MSEIVIPENEKGFQAEVLLHSLNIATGTELVTFRVKYPLMVHQDFIRHRALSRSVASNRAIPTSRQLATVTQDPIYPMRWGKNQPGMSASERNLSQGERIVAKEQWDIARMMCVKSVYGMNAVGLHKQWANRPLTAFQWVTEVLTATDWCNLWGLRFHGAAQDEMQHIVKLMLDCYTASKPEQLRPGQWHIPYTKDCPHLALPLRLKVSAARTARTSYRTHEGKVSTPEEDVTLYNEKLAGSPLHASPLEHPAMAMQSILQWIPDWTALDLEQSPERVTAQVESMLMEGSGPGSWRESYYGNFCGFLQFRALHKRETLHKFEYNGVKLSDDPSRKFTIHPGSSPLE